MKKLLIATLVLGTMWVLPARSEAFCWISPCVSYRVCYETRVVTCYKPQWNEEKVEVVVNRLQCKEVVEKTPIKVMVAKWVDGQQTVTRCHYEPVTLVKEVVSCRYTPVCVIDPCTGCPYTVLAAQPCVEKVACTVYQAKLVQEVVPVKVCQWVPEERVVETRRMEWFSVPEKQIVVRRFCTMVPYQTTVQVPVCVPCCP